MRRRLLEVVQHLISEDESFTEMSVERLVSEAGISRSTFYDWRAKRRAPRCISLPNGSLRVRRADLDRWLSAHEDAA